jgi:hypothetical protein
MFRGDISGAETYISVITVKPFDSSRHIIAVNFIHNFIEHSSL